MNENGELDIYENKLFEDEIKIGEENKTLVNQSYWTPRENSGFNEYVNTVSNSAINLQKKKIKEYFRISPCFFKMCLKTPTEFNKIFKKIFQLMFAKSPFHVGRKKYSVIEALDLKYYDKILEICVYTDIINNEASEKAIEYVLNINRNTKEQPDKND